MIGSGLDHSSGLSGNFGNASSRDWGGERTLVVSEALTTATANRLMQQLTLLDDSSGVPVTVVMSNAPGGDARAGLSVYDTLRSVCVPVTMVGGGRIAGAGVVAFAGATRERRVGLPHVRFRFEPPTASVHSTGGDAQAGTAEEQRDRIVQALAVATGQPEERIETDRSARRTFDADAAVEYGLIKRVVESRRAVE